MDKTASWKPQEFRLHILQQLCQILTQSVSSSFIGIRGKQGDKVQGGAALSFYGYGKAGTGICYRADKGKLRLCPVGLYGKAGVRIGFPLPAS